MATHLVRRYDPDWRNLRIASFRWATALRDIGAFLLGRPPRARGRLKRN